MNTLHFTNAYHSASGAVRTFYHALFDQAPRHRRRVSLVVSGEADGVEDVNEFARIHFVRAAPSPIVDRRVILPHRFLWPHAGRIWSILEQERPGLVEICDKYSLCHLAGVIRTVRRPRPALVGLTCKRIDDDVRALMQGSPLAARLARRYVRQIYAPQFDAHIASSHYTAAELLPAAERHARPVYVRPMGVDTITFTPARRDRARRARRRSALGLAAAAPLLLYAGRLSTDKHVPLLFDMMRKLGRTGAHLVLAGEGPLRTTLESRAATLCPGRVHFMDHLTDRGALADLFADADLLVHPNPHEPFGMAPLEAMAAGLPVVVPDRGGVATYATPRNAWPAEPSGDALAAAVVDALTNAAERERRRDRASTTAAAHAWPVAAAAFFQLYDRIAAEHSVRRRSLAHVACSAGIRVSR